MAYSDWQLNRLRNALSAYHAYGDPKEDQEPEEKGRKEKRARAHNWMYVAEGIAVASGLEDRFFSDDPSLDLKSKTKLVKQYAERLRQFVEGFTGPDGRHKYTEPKNVDAIVAFATHPAYRLLSKEELQEFRPDWHAPHRLLEYLDQELDTERMLPPAYLEGTYEGERRTEDALVSSQLTLQRASRQGMIQVVQIDELYDPSVQSVRSLSAKERAKARNNKPHKKYGGWAILTPEDTLLLFMKEARYHHNHYYFTLASDLSRATEQPVTRLTCLYHDYGLEPDDGGLWDVNMLSAAAAILLEGNIVYFNRIEPHADA